MSGDCHLPTNCVVWLWTLSCGLLDAWLSGFTFYVFYVGREFHVMQNGVSAGLM